jgi:flavin-dependent dehydrogenase
MTVLIVGGGPAGLTTALSLAHTCPGLTDRIVVLEQGRYPRDKICAGAIGARADAALAELGVRVHVPSVPVHGVSLRTPEGRVVSRKGWIGRVVRRTEFDHGLATAARRAGIRVVEGARATSIALGSSHVEVTTSQGAFRGDVVVGADGVGSIVRRAMGLGPGTLRGQAIEVCTEPVAADRDRDLAHFDVSDETFDGYTWDFPTAAAGVPLVCRGAYALRTNRRPVDLVARLAGKLAAIGLELGRFRVKRFGARGFDPTVPMACRRALLVGEAAGVDPLTGEGIPQAIAYGRLAGEHLATKIAEADVDLRDFARLVAGSPLGIDLSLRSRLARHYFGTKRAALDRFLYRTPAFVSASLELFAGRHVSRAKLAWSAVSAAWHLTR